ncbi:MAG TPA: phosphotransferase [Candidatus Hydrogenedens sp.]|nr:phosphotransferase [Candidatus Hydrogenedens sp.]
MTVQLQGLEIIADVIRKNYDLGEVGLPRPLEGAHQRRHRKMVVETSRGVFLAKTYTRDIAVIDALNFQHRLSDHLFANGLPVARIQKAKSGKGYVEVDNWVLELQEFVKGEPMTLTMKTLQISAKALGKFHKVCYGLPAPPRDVNMWRFSEVPKDIFLHFFKLAREEKDESSLMPYFNYLVEFIQRSAQELSIEKRSEFEVGLIHGDWHGANLLFSGEKLLAIIDLEFAGQGCYLEDISYAISNLCIRTSMNTDKLRMRTLMLLEQYERKRTLSYAELVALFYAVGIKHITTVSYQSKNNPNVAGLFPSQWMERLSFQCRWLEEQSRKARWGEKL